MKGNWIRTAGLVIASMAAVLGVPQDYGNLAGGSDRVGRNTGATLNTAGRGLLTWYAPLINDIDGYELIRNDLSSEVTATGTWLASAPIDEAVGAYYGIPSAPTVRADLPSGDPGFPLFPVRERINYFENQLRGLVWFGTPPAPTGWSLPPQPSYRYSATIPAASDPKVAQFGGDPLNIFEWAVQPPADPSIPNQRYPRNYALYTYINIGPQGDGVGGFTYPARYQVYEIIYDGTRSYTDVVDTYAGGTGWVRLGNGGLPTDKLFTYNGVDPIRIRLHNTVPRLAGHGGDVINAPYPVGDPRWLNHYPDQPYQTIVYADAVKAVPTTGEYIATPIVSAINPAIASPFRVWDARNEFLVGQQNGESQTTKTGIVRMRDHNTGAVIWKFAPLDDSALTTQQDNNSVGVTFGAPWAVSTAEPGYRGTNYLKAPIVVVPGTEQVATYAPTLTDGTYEIQVWMPGDRGAEILGRQVVYEILEGATSTLVVVDQSVGGGWVRLGTRRFAHDNSGGNPLSVRVSNLSNNVADVGRESFADQIQFIGAANLAITSTPVHSVANVVTTNGGPSVLTPVILVAAEDGKIYCLDAAGNGDGTTNVYWTYPSTPDRNDPAWTDPNAVPAEDGGIAQMPTGFDLSTALVENIGGVDYLYVATRNGRIYCIEMAGRGDMNLATRLPGTTRRVWSYPNDYPAPAARGNLGGFTGSLTFGITAAGPTIFAGAPHGRMYALEALPAPVTNKTTNVRWTYPALNAPTLGPIRMTPVFFNNDIYFGTDIADGDDRGRFFSIDADAGTVNWEFNGTTAWGGGINFVNADGFVSTPATATNAQLGLVDPDTIFIANENRWITALETATGNVIWTTNELNSPINAGLTVLEMNVFDALGGRTPAPIVMCPTADGRFSGLFARGGVGFPGQNIYGTKLAWQYNAAGAPITSTMASGRSYLYGADAVGYLYGFNDFGNGFGGDIEGPGEQVFVPNDQSDPDVQDFRGAKLIFVTKDTFQRLQRAPGDPLKLSYAEALDPARAVARTAFDWGEIVYALAYDFPYLNTYTEGGLTGTSAPPPIVNFQVGVEGASVRNLTLQSDQFRDPLTAPMAPSGSRRLDGFACLSYIIQSSGSNAMPPGTGRMSYSVSSTALTDPPRSVTITPNPAQVIREFIIANPLALIMVPGDPLRQIGNTINPNDPEVAYNGNANDPSTAGKHEGRLFAGTGTNSHGQGGLAVIGVVDRSLMTLLRGPGRGLDQVRFSRGDMAWQNGKGQVYKRIDSIPYYAAFYATGKGLEDYPELFPNISLDYPNIQRERILVVSDINGNAENPVFGPTFLKPPTNVDESVNPPTRINDPTTYDITVLVPRFQPPNMFQGNIDSALTNVLAGYYGNMSIFVDSNGDGTLTRNGGRREAFRSFWLGSGVAIDERFAVETPTIDIGALASGTGYDPADPNLGTSYSPWGGPFVPLFKPFVIRNNGNVNLLNIRLAKFYANGSVNPWEVFSTTNHELSWLDGSRSVHSTLDPMFSLHGPGNPNVFPKGRVGDTSGPTYRDNPGVRLTPTLPINIPGPLLVGQPDPENPVVSVSLPIGHPAGTYSQILRVIEDSTPDLVLPLDASGVPSESTSDPGLNIKFTSVETQTTTSRSEFVAPIIDDLVITQAENFFWMNNQPAMMRTMGGHLVTAFVSDRTGGTVGAGFDKTLPINPVTDQPTRLFIGSAQGATPAAASGSSPLRDLYAFVPQPPRWFRRDVADYPTTALATLFPGSPVLANTARFGAPSLPAAGDRNPFTGAVHPFTYLAFTGSIQKQNPNEREIDSRVFLGQMTVANDGSVTLTDPVGLPNDPQMLKSRPSVFQVGDDAVVFYTAFGTGQSAIHFSVYNGATWGATRVFQVGKGFESVGGANVSGRQYGGLGGTGLPASGSNILEISFTGKRRGKPANEIFLGRMAVNGANPGNQVYFPVRTREYLRAETETGTYSTSGLDWNLNANAPVLEYSLNGGLPVNIEVPNTRVTDRTTGVISFDTTLGGKAYLDPGLGTVKLASTLPARNASLLLTYQPRFLRISTTDAGYSLSTMMFDNRLIGEGSYWATSANTGINQSPLDPVRPGRYVFTYNRAAAGNGQAPRPYMHTLRVGVNLPYSVATLANGNLVNMSVTGATSFYQVDPANGRLYFTQDMENRPITVTYTGVDDAGNPVNVGPLAFTATLVTERTEAPIFMNQAVNESQLTSFLDPFDETAPNVRRPGLIWMFWTSTRAGTPDVFFQTIAPKFTPVASNR